MSTVNILLSEFLDWFRSRRLLAGWTYKQKQIEFLDKFLGWTKDLESVESFFSNNEELLEGREIFLLLRSSSPFPKRELVWLAKWRRRKSFD